jgi:hypothetical protein
MFSILVSPAKTGGLGSMIGKHIVHGHGDMSDVTFEQPPARYLMSVMA